MKKTLALLIFVAIIASLSVVQQVDHTSGADVIAKEMANANTTLGSLNFQFDYIHYRGDLPYHRATAPGKAAGCPDRALTLGRET